MLSKTSITYLFFCDSLSGLSFFFLSNPMVYLLFIIYINDLKLSSGVIVRCHRRRRPCTVNMEPYIMYVRRYQSVRRNNIIKSTFFCSIVLSFSRSVVRCSTFCRSVVLSFFHSVALSFYHSVILSFSIILSFCRSVVLFSFCTGTKNTRGETYPPF